MEKNYQKNQNFSNLKSKIDLSHVFDDVIEQRQRGQNQKPKKKKISRRKLNIIYITIVIISWIIIGFLLFKKENIEEEEFISPDEFTKYLKEHEEM